MGEQGLAVHDAVLRPDLVPGEEGDEVTGMYRLRFVSKRFSGMAIGLRNGNPIRCRAVSSLIWC